MADTGCQSCLASIKVIRRLGLCESDLIPVTMKMHAVNNKGISILGAVILRFSGRSPSGKALESRQIVHVTSDSDKLFLSRETCMALGIITKNFPIQPPCTCQRRITPPPSPQPPPFPATENSRMKMQQWLLDYYRTSTFNTCEHQPLPLMESIPMRLMVDPQAKPVAHHNPIPVPLHWQEEVKAGLDQDVSLGVLEPVPGGEPVTWCHRMVVCAKKNGTRHVKPTTRKAPSTRHVQSQATPKRPCLTVGMVTTAFPSMRTIDTSPPSSLHGVATAIKQHLKAT
ncbi:unnamed protein product [Pocillopora meandrina]|uniref:Uncharacterized protein n=1 Tax=Pocillopora meandrina TaxID=46732 RepID=A0AAU9W1N8_9CNID|nr:unnamed protein product [Pocillopora meandrina]